MERWQVERPNAAIPIENHYDNVNARIDQKEPRKPRRALTYAVGMRDGIRGSHEPDQVVHTTSAGELEVASADIERRSALVREI